MANPRDAIAADLLAPHKHGRPAASHPRLFNDFQSHVLRQSHGFGERLVGDMNLRLRQQEVPAPLEAFPDFTQQPPLIGGLVLVALIGIYVLA